MTPIILPIAELKPALAGFSKIPTSKNTLPILHHVKVERTREGWLTLTKTDLDSFLTVRMEQPSSGEPTAFLVPLDAIAALVKRSSPKDTLILAQNPDKSLSLQSSTGEQTKIQHLPVQDFPIIPRIQGDPVPVPAEMRQAIHQAMECASVDQRRHTLNGVFLDVSQPKNHHVVSTDGRHLYTSNSFTLPIPHSFILPRSKFLGWRGFNEDGEWRIKTTDIPDAKTKLLVQLSTRKWRYITKAIEGQYPNWRQVLVNPASIKTVVSIEPGRTEHLFAKIESMPCHNNEHFPIGLELVNGKLTLLGKTPEAKTWDKQPFDRVKVSGPDVTVFLNRHLLIKAFRFGLLDIGIVDSISPMRLSHGSREMIVMPTRANNDKGPVPPRSAAVIRAPRRSPQPRPAPVFHDAFAGIQTLKQTFKAGLDLLKSLTSSLKEVRRTQKENERQRTRKNPAACT